MRPDIRKLYLYLCPIPAILLVLMVMTNGNFNMGGPRVTFFFLFTIALMVLCPLLTLMGGILLLCQPHPVINKYLLFLATGFAAFPGICALLLLA